MTAALLEKVSFDFPLEVLKQTEVAGEFHIVGYAATTDFDLQGDVITEEALADARARIEAWRVDYNEVRPHSALDNMTPKEFMAALEKTTVELGQELKHQLA